MNKLPLLIILVLLAGVSGVSAACTSTISVVSGDIYVYGSGTANLTCIAADVSDETLLNETSSKIWILNADIIINASGATLYLNSSDVDHLRINSTDNIVFKLWNQKGTLSIDATKITSWNTTSGSVVTSGDRAYIRYGENDGDAPKGNITNSNISYLGYGNEGALTLGLSFTDWDGQKIEDTVITGNRFGIYLQRYNSNVTLDNITVSDSHSSALDIWAQNEDIIVNNSVFDNNNWVVNNYEAVHFARFGTSRRLQLLNTVIQNNQNRGLHIELGSTITIDNVTSKNNTFADFEWRNIQGLTIKNCNAQSPDSTVTELLYYHVAMKQSDFIFLNNTGNGTGDGKVIRIYQTQDVDYNFNNLIGTGIKYGISFRTAELRNITIRNFTFNSIEIEIYGEQKINESFVWDVDTDDRVVHIESNVASSAQDMNISLMYSDNRLLNTSGTIKNLPNYAIDNVSVGISLVKFEWANITYYSTYIYPNSGVINVTKVSTYNSTFINFTVLNNTASQTMNITITNGTFIVTNGVTYTLKKDGVQVDSQAASGTSVSFVDVSVGSSYVIEGSGADTTVGLFFYGIITTVFSDGSYLQNQSVAGKTQANMTIVPSSENITVELYNWTTAYKKWNESADNTSVTVTHTICDNSENSKMRLKILNTPSGKIYRYKNTNGTGCLTYTYTLGYANGTVTYILTQRGGPNLAVAATGGTGISLLILYLYRLRRRRR